MEMEYQHIRMNFEGQGHVTIRRRVKDDGKAVIYTDMPTLKRDLRVLAATNPELVTMLVDDPESEENPEADTGVIQALTKVVNGVEVALLILPESGYVGAMRARGTDVTEDTFAMYEEVPYEDGDAEESDGEEE